MPWFVAHKTFAQVSAFLIHTTLPLYQTKGVNIIPAVFDRSKRFQKTNTPPLTFIRGTQNVKLHSCAWPK